LIASAPAKLNLCLRVGPTRDDGLHEIRSLFCPLDLADSIAVADAAADSVSIPGVAGDGPDLTARALAALREAGWERGPVAIGVDKRIPVAAGLGGGSADAAAVLRLAADALSEEAIASIAFGLGADVTSQLDPRFCLVAGAGEDVRTLPAPAPFGVVLVADPEGLSTPAVYAEADRLGVGMAAAGLEAVAEDLEAAALEGAHPLEYRHLLVNDLGGAAISLRPEIESTLAALGRAGAEHSLVAGSGPTAVGLCPDLAAAELIASRLGLRDGLRVIVCSGGGG